ncbi:MAG: hypothetical protein B6D73_10265 [gamma proteobacterium symbiont of Stewartia floridana]|nr:MAG: hypothetical protein B6D73_10265 [gamma proteobacterium symbiont of Stewartia floridana]
MPFFGQVQYRTASIILTLVLLHQALFYPQLMPATRASPGSDWVTWLRFSKLFYMAQQHKDQLPGGVLPERS